MVITQAEENKNKIISLAITLVLFSLLLLFLFLYIIITPNPPFEEVPGGGGGIEFNIGNMIEGTGNVDNNGIGEAVKVVESTEATEVQNASSSEDLVTSDNGEPIDVKKNENPPTQNNNTVVIPVKPKEKTAAELLAEKFNKNKGKTGGGDGNSGQAGDDGRPDGNPNTHGNGGTGGGIGGGNGDSNGPGKGSGSGGIGFSLTGRSVVLPPTLSKDTKEEGKVVVEITVDKTGTVIKADPNGRGTTTNSAILKAKARQAALATKFNPSNDYEEQKGTITIIFSF